MKEFFRKLIGQGRFEEEKQSLPQVQIEKSIDSNKNEFVLNEIERLAEIIARHEKHAFTVKAFLAAVVTGLATMVYSRDISGDAMTSWKEFGAVGAGAIVAFWIWATAHRVLSVRAIDRTTDIEDELRGDSKKVYNGPRVTKAMNPPEKWYSWQSWRKFFKRGFYITHATPFIIAGLAVVFLTFAYYTKQLKQEAVNKKNEDTLQSDRKFRDATFPDLKGYQKCQALFKVDKENTKQNTTKLVLDSVSCDIK